MDEVTEPFRAVSPSAVPSALKNPRNMMMVASGALGAVLAAIVVLVWSYSNGPMSQGHKPSSSPATATAAPAAAAPAPAPAPSDSGLPFDLPAGLSGAGGDANTLDPMAALTGIGDSSPSGSSGVGGSAPALSLPEGAPLTMPNVDPYALLNALVPVVGPALAPSLISGDAIAGIIIAAGGWVSSAITTTANNSVALLNNIILASALTNQNPIQYLSGIFTSLFGPLATLVTAAGTALAVPAAVQGGLTMLQDAQQSLASVGTLSSVVGSAVPALDSLTQLTMNMPQLPQLPALPAPPAIGLPQLPALPALPPIGLPALPPLPGLI